MYRKVRNYRFTVKRQEPSLCKIVFLLLIFIILMKLELCQSRVEFSNRSSGVVSVVKLQKRTNKLETNINLTQI